MELVLAFLIGWAAGAKGGEQGFQDVADAARALRQSDEFRDLLAALRSHLAATLRALAGVISSTPGTDEETDAQSVVSRVLRLVREGGARGNAF